MNGNGNGTLPYCRFDCRISKRQRQRQSPLKGSIAIAAVLPSVGGGGSNSPHPPPSVSSLGACPAHQTKKNTATAATPMKERHP